MTFKTNHIGSAGNKPSPILELTVSGNGFTATEDILNFKNDKVNQSFIYQLRELANELEEYNNDVDKYKT
jgi:hypothetical protein